MKSEACLGCTFEASLRTGRTNYKKMLCLFQLNNRNVRIFTQLLTQGEGFKSNAHRGLDLR